LARERYANLVWSARVKCVQNIINMVAKTFVIVVYLIRVWLLIHMESKEQIIVLQIFNIAILNL